MRRALLIALGIAFVLTSPALAFHDGGVARCSGCHTMHNSQDGVLVDPDSPDGNPWLLKDATPSDVCLGCHATRRGAVFADSPTSPKPERGPGNFIFLLADNLNDGHNGANNPISGDAGGHNLDAPGHGVATDGTLSSGPGGEFPASVMGCTSCHDPHGSDTYRLLYGAGRLVQDFYTFTNPAPNAEGLPSLNSGYEQDTLHVAYKGGMSAWCGNCHGDFHASDVNRHPSGVTMPGSIVQTYNLYNGTMDQTGGSAATAYLPQVAFEDAGMTVNSTAGPTGSSRVACISCHRAHASSAMDSGRWDFQVTFLHEDGEESGSYQIPDPYNELNQRSLCNKCHNKDAFDHNPF